MSKIVHREIIANAAGITKADKLAEHITYWLKSACPKEQADVQVHSHAGPLKGFTMERVTDDTGKTGVVLILRFGQPDEEE